MEAQPVCGAVMPHQHMAWPLPHRSDGIWKTHGGFIGESFHNATARKAKEFGVSVFQELHQVLAHPVAFVGFTRHEGGESKTNGACFGRFDEQFSFKVVRSSGKGAVVPFITAWFYHDFGLILNRSVFGSNCNLKHGVFADGFCEHVKMAAFSFFERNALIADVINHAICFKCNLERGQTFGIQTFCRIQPHFCVFCVPGRNRGRGNVMHPLFQPLAVVELIRPAHWCGEDGAVFVQRTAFRWDGVLKTPVAEHFRVQAAVTCTVDVFKKQPVQVGRNGKTFFFCLNGNPAHVVLLSLRGNADDRKRICLN